jgi:spore coat polysaccharide biosynthesis protein SpsF
MSSTRLPGKVLADLDGRPVLEWVVSRLRDSRELADVVVATSGDASDDPVAEAAPARVVRGPLDDVLGRYAVAARELGSGALVRITADCPLIDPAVVDEVVAAWRTGDEDYVANVIEPRTYPVGMDTEVVSADALLAADAEATEPYDREHVTPFVRSRPDRFPQRAVSLDPPRPDVRLTLDTADDLEHLRAVVAQAGPHASLAELIAAA